MFEYLRLKWRLRHLHKSIQQTKKAYAQGIAQATKEKKGRDVIHGISESEHSELRLYYDEIAQIKSRALCTTASRLDIPIPTDSDCWEESYVIGGRALTASAFSELRTAVRKEQNERWTYWELRLKVLGAVLTATTGATGALIGLVAIWKK